MKTGIELIAAKRDKHLTKHGYDAEHDLEHTYMQFVNAARAYMYRDVHFWPFDRKSFKLGNDEENLANSGSMIAAAIDRINGTGHKTKSSTFTSEEILTKSHLYGDDGTALWNKDEVIMAMEEYANQFKSLSPNREEGGELQSGSQSLRLQLESLKFRKVGNVKQKYYNEAIDDALSLLSPSSTPLEQKELKSIRDAEFKEVATIFTGSNKIEIESKSHDFIKGWITYDGWSGLFHIYFNQVNHFYYTNCHQPNHLAAYRYLESKGYQI